MNCNKSVLAIVFYFVLALSSQGIAKSLKTDEAPLDRLPRGISGGGSGGGLLGLGGLLGPLLCPLVSTLEGLLDGLPLLGPILGGIISGIVNAILDCPCSASTAAGQTPALLGGFLG